MAWCVQEQQGAVLWSSSSMNHDGVQEAFMTIQAHGKNNVLSSRNSNLTCTGWEIPASLYTQYRSVHWKISFTVVGTENTVIKSAYRKSINVGANLSFISYLRGHLGNRLTSKDLGFLLCKTERISPTSLAIARIKWDKTHQALSPLIFLHAYCNKRMQ